jgi:antitoxin component HigA of HigAB toxin-antitoxin module
MEAIRPIKTEEQYRETLKRIDSLIDAEPIVQNLNCLKFFLFWQMITKISIMQLNLLTQ